jgi:hypothetical protein
MNLLPAIGTTGIYTLLPPFETKLLTNVSYRCAAVRRLEDIVAAGANPFTEHYEPAQISRAKYEEDMAAGVCIVSLIAGSGAWVYVPSSYIASMPDQNGIPYSVMLLGVKLSALPDSQDLALLKSKIVDTVTEYLGIDSEIREVVVSPPMLISRTEHNALEASRQEAISNVETDYAKLLAKTAQLNAALLKITELENYIISLQPQP